MANWYNEFDGAFWLTLSGAIFAFGGVCLQSILKSRCKEFNCCCLSCTRDAPHEPTLDIPTPPTPPRTQRVNSV
jgi:hypothetical protein